MKAACDVKTTSHLMVYTTDIRGVGGPVDVATSLELEGTNMSRQSKFVVSDLFRESTAACNAVSACCSI